MAEKTSKIWALGLLLAVALAAASLAVSLTVTYGPSLQKTVTTTSTTTQTVMVTTTYTTTVTTTPKAGLSVSVVSSVGRCGVLEKPTLTFEREGEYVLLSYAEQTSVPCFRHVITRSIVLEMWPPIIDITLKLEPTSDVCIECVGVVETTLRVGPVPDGTDIVVNGLRIVV